MADDLPSVEFSRWFLAGFFAFVAAFYTARIITLGRRAGRSPVAFGKPGSRHHLNYLLFRVFRVAILLVCVLRVPFPAIDAFLIPITPLWQPWIILCGNLLLLVSFACILLVHAYMVTDWRSGIHGERPGRLLTTGPFALTRNPVAILIQLAQLGLFLSLPSLFTLVCLAIGIWVMQGQVRLEEADLERRHGDAYRAYRARAPRWLSWPWG